MEQYRLLAECLLPANMLDWFDIHCEIQPLTFDQISKKNTPLCEGSSSIRERVINARNIQEIR